MSTDCSTPSTVANDDRADANVLQVPLLVDVSPQGFGIEPVRAGVFLPPGRIHGNVNAIILGLGVESVVQTEALTRWPDGSIRGLLVDFLLDHSETVPSSLCLELSAIADDRPAVSMPIVTCQNDFASVKSGMMAFEFQVLSGRLIMRVTDAAVTIADTTESFARFVDTDGNMLFPHFDRIVVQNNGPICTSVDVHGTVSGSCGLNVRLRMTCFHHVGLVRCDVTLHNPHRARHQGGLWDLGDSGSAKFREFSLKFSVLPEQTTRNIRYRLAADEAFIDVSSGPLAITQEASGGDNWQSACHVNHLGRHPLRHCGCQVHALTANSECLRPEPVVCLTSDGHEMSVANPEFWQQFPNSIAVTGAELTVSCFPDLDGVHHELQGGERKTKSVWLRFGKPAGESTRSLDWVFRPSLVRVASQEFAGKDWRRNNCRLPNVEHVFNVLGTMESCPTYFCLSANSWVAHLLPRSDAALDRYDRYLEAGLHTLLSNRERVDEYGWRNYGDVFADHEQTYYEGSKPLISHYNNQFDMIHGFLLQYLRTGERRWFELGDALARHVVDIDIYHTTKDKAAYNGGLFWFTDHYLHAETSTHRTYSRSNAKAGKPYGGGPGAEHNFTSGLLLHFHLTGNPDSRDAVLGLANWVVDMDEGRNTILGILDDGPTGLASAGAAKPARGGGNSINALLDAWTLTNNATWLHAAEALIRRCIHPDDDVSERELLDVEKNWSYTVFLTSLAKYLELKQEAGQIDEMYAYAQASLLHYAEWMLVHELPYFDQFEKLEFPTEAWAAQEFRKANVLRHAAVHAGEDMRPKLLDRGDKLADRAWHDLERFETRTYARAMAVVMIEGLKDCWFRERRFEIPEQLNSRPNFGSPQMFETQKQRFRSLLTSPLAWPRLAMRVVNPWRWARYLRLGR